MEALVADGKFPFGSTDHQRQYATFLEAVLSGDMQAIQACIEPQEFGAYIPGRYRLLLDDYLKFMAGLREFAPNFGEDISVVNAVEDGNLLALLYRTRYKVADTVVSGQGNQVAIVCSDWVTFNAQGKIIEIRVIYDRFDAQEQAFGKAFPLNPGDSAQ